MKAVKERNSLSRLQTLLDNIIHRIVKLLARQGHLIEEDGIVYLARTESLDPDNVLAPLQAASTSYRIYRSRAKSRAQSAHPAKHIARRMGATHHKPSCPARETVRQPPRPFDKLRTGFSLHAGVHCAVEDRKSIEPLRRYITRPAISNERLGTNREGNAVLKLKTPWRNGATHIVLTPMEFMQRLAALVPRPRLHLIRFHGVLAPNAKLRSQVVPVPPARTTAGEGDCTHGTANRCVWRGRGGSSACSILTSSIACAAAS